MSFKPLMGVRGPMRATAAALCVPLSARAESELVQQARRARDLQPDLVEWRVDALEMLRTWPATRDELRRVAAALRDGLGELPMILTVRASREGGGVEGLSDTARVEVLIELASILQPQFIDIELSTGVETRSRLATACRQMGIQLVISSHDFSATSHSSELSKIFDAMLEAGADVAKLAVTPKEFSEVLRLMSVTREAADRLGIPVIGIAMGDLGMASRLFATECGSALTFVTDIDASAPGQLTLESYRKIRALLSV